MIMAQTIHTFTKDGFDIRFAVFPELTHPNDHFDDDGETARAIAAGDYEWFVAMVTASKNGIELAEEYLGGCCYETFEAFMQPGDYFDDMVASAIDQAKQNIDALTA
jgi:hypothetical protein